MSPEEALERASWLVRSQSTRTTMQEELQKVFQLDWNDDALINKPPWVQEVKDPQPFNSMQWLVDVLAHDEPQVQIEIPEGAMPQALPPMGMSGMLQGGQGGQGGMGMSGMSPPMMSGISGMSPSPMDPMQQMLGGMGMGMPMQDEMPEQESGADYADKLENMVKAWFKENDRRSATSLQRDELYAGFVNGMIVDKVGDLRLGAGKHWDKYVAQNRGASPFVIKSQNPAQVYFEFDDYGLCEVVHRYLRPLSQVKRIYGNVEGLVGVKAQDAVTGFALFTEYWTKDTTAKWLEQIEYSGYGDENYRTTGTTEQITGYFLEQPHDNDLGFIPYSIKIARGTGVFHRQNMVYPHLYAGHKSKLFLRQNLLMTVQATLAFMFANPVYLEETDTPEAPTKLDFSRPGVVGVAKGNKITQFEFNMTPEFQNVAQLFQAKIEESTVSKVVAGQSPGGVTAAAGINLLIGGGKLTVSPVQSALGEVRAGAIHNIFEYIRAYPTFAENEGRKGLEMYLKGGFEEIDPASLPERMDISVQYNAMLPQDKALAVQTWLTPLMQGLISSDLFYKETGIQDVVTLRQQIQKDKDRVLADQQFQQQMLPPVDPATGQPMDPSAMQNPQGGENDQGSPEAQPGMPGVQAQDAVVNGPTSNPQPTAANPANALNTIFNSLQNPMTGVG